MVAKEYKDYVLDKLSLLDNIRAKSMMGGYLFYYNEVLFGGIYVPGFLIKIVDENKKYNLPEEIPYKGAKLMYSLESIEDRELIKEIVIVTTNALINNK